MTNQTNMQADEQIPRHELNDILIKVRFHGMEVSAAEELVVKLIEPYLSKAINKAVAESKLTPHYCIKVDLGYSKCSCGHVAESNYTLQSHIDWYKAVLQRQHLQDKEAA